MVDLNIQNKVSIVLVAHFQINKENENEQYVYLKTLVENQMHKKNEDAPNKSSDLSFLVERIYHELELVKQICLLEVIKITVHLLHSSPPFVFLVSKRPLHILVSIQIEQGLTGDKMV